MLYMVVPDSGIVAFIHTHAHSHFVMQHCKRDNVKPGLWTLDWTGLDCTVSSVYLKFIYRACLSGMQG